MNEHDGSTLISNNRMIQLHIEKSNSDYDPNKKVYEISNNSTNQNTFLEFMQY